MTQVRVTQTLLRCALFSVLFLLGACGWQLRGRDSSSEVSTGSTLEEQAKVRSSTSSVKAPPTPVIKNKTIGDGEIQSTAVTSESGSGDSDSEVDKSGFRLVMQQRNHGLAAALNRSAFDNKVEFSNTGYTWLVVESEKLEKRPLTVTETGVAAQYQLVLTVNFSLRNAKGDLLSTPQQIVSWRSYDFDAKLIVAKAQEEEALIVEMREELANRMLTLMAAR